jgi:tetratricopeptide (TPR) repeat protein
MGLLNFFKKKNSEEILEIGEDIFQSQHYQQNILASAIKKYYELDHSYDAIALSLKTQGHNDVQTETLLVKLKANINKMVSDYEDAERSGVISEIKITPNPKHFENIGDIKQADRYIAYGCYQMEKGYLENAIELFDAGLKINPDDYKGYANKASALNQQGKIDEAMSCINMAISIQPNDIQVYQSKADMMETQKNYEVAASCYIESLKIEPNNIDVLSSIAFCYCNLRNEKEAVIYFDKIIALDNDNLEARLNKSVALFSAKDEKANEYYYELINRYPNQPEAISVKPMYLERDGKSDEARLVYDELYQKTNDVEYIKFKAYYLYHADKPRAIETCYTYLNKKQEDAIMLAFLAQLLVETGGSELHVVLDRLLQIAPNDFNGLYHKVRTSFLRGDVAEALAFSDRLYQLQPLNQDVIKQRISLFEKAKTKQETFDLFNDMIRRNPSEKYNINYQRALYLKAKGDYLEAIMIFERQNSIHQFAWNYYQLAIIYNILSDVPKCIQFLSKAFSMDASLKVDAKEFPELNNLQHMEEFIKITS